MKREFQKFISRSQKICLSKKERHAFRSLLQEHMTQTASSVRKTSSFRQTWGRGANLFHITFNFKKYMFVNLFLAILVVLGGGTAFAAESSVPGEALYPVKVHVNENVRSLATVGLENQTQWDLERGERRLEEAAVLAQRGVLSEEVKSKLSEKVENRLKQAEKNIVHLQEKGNSRAAVALSNALQARLQAGASLLVSADTSNKEGNRPSPQVQELLERVNNLVDRAAVISETTELEASAEADNQPEVSVENRKNLAEKKLERVKKLLQDNKEKMDPEIFAKAQAQLDATHETFIKAVTEFEAKNYRVAFTLFGEVNNLLERLQAFIKIHIHSRLDIKIPDFPFKLRLHEEMDSSVTSTVSTGHKSERDDKHEEKNKDAASTSTLHINTTAKAQVKETEHKERREEYEEEQDTVKIQINGKSNDGEKFELRVRGDL